MKIWKVIDKYNPHKVWIIKRTKDRHYYANQMICGKIFYSRYQRITKDRWSDILEGVR